MPSLPSPSTHHETSDLVRFLRLFCSGVLTYFRICCRVIRVVTAASYRSLSLPVAFRKNTRAEKKSVKIGEIKLDAPFCACTGAESSSVVLNGRRGANVSCKIRGCRKKTVDGIRITGSESMISTVGPELLDLINPGWSWKKVPKGYRSNPRRKPTCRNISMGKFLFDKGARKVDDMTISDDEKNGVDLLGRHFNERVEQVPFKKRRFTDGSSSPAKQKPSLGQRSIQPSHHGKRQCRTTDASFSNKCMHNLTDVAIKNKFECPEDFSGIEILAAVACDNGMIYDTNLDKCSPKRQPTAEGTDSSNYRAVESPADLVLKQGKTEVSALWNTEVTTVDKATSTQGDAMIEASISSRVHWDLNVTMDAWENPCSVSSVDPPPVYARQSETKTDSDRSQESLDTLGEPVDIKYSVLDNSKDSPTCKSAQVSDKYGAFSNFSANYDDHVPSPAGNFQNPSGYVVDEVKSSNCLTDVVTHLGHSVCSEVPDHKEETQGGEEVCMPDAQPTESSYSKTVKQADTCNATSQHPVVMKKCCYEFDHTTSKGDEMQACQKEFVVSIGVEPGVPIEDSGDFNLPGHGKTCTSGLSVSECQPVATATATAQLHVDEASLTNTAEVDSPAHDGSKEWMQKSSVDSTATHSEAFGTQNRCVSSLVKAINEDPYDDNYESDVYQADKLHAIDGEDMTGYDSQFEDGELRDYDACYYRGENVGEVGEVDYTDYGYECEEDRLCGMANEKDISGNKGLNRGPENVTSFNHSWKGDSRGDDSLSPQTRAADVTTVKDLQSAVGSLRAFDRESPFCNELRDGMCRKDAVLRSRVGYVSTYHQDGRGASSRKFVGVDRHAYMRGRSPGGQRFVKHSVGYWKSERHSSPPHQGSNTYAHSRPRDVVGTRGYMVAYNHTDPEVSDFAGFDNRVRRHFNNSSSNGRHEHFVRRTPTSREEGYSIRRVMLPGRDISPGRNRFGRCHQGTGKGMREEYHGAIQEDNSDYSNHHRFVRGERSISPVRRCRTHYTFPCKESRSRSSSRSPSGYLPLRERNGGSRLSCRSPKFRPNARIDRGRMPLQKRLPAEYDEGRSSPRRSRFSSPHLSRCFQDRNGALDNSFRVRTSPGRMFRQNQRFDSLHSMRRLNSDAKFRPLFQSRNFPDGDAGGRRSEYESGGDYDREKGRDRLEMVQRVRRCNADGVVRRFHYSAEESFVDNDSHYFDHSNKLTGRRPRDDPMRANEEVAS